MDLPVRQALNEILLFKKSEMTNNVRLAGSRQETCSDVDLLMSEDFKPTKCRSNRP